jgi:hypothetical protein
MPKESLDLNNDHSRSTSVSIHGEKEGSGPSAPSSTIGHSTQSTQSHYAQSHSARSVQSHPTHSYSQSGFTTSTSSRRPLSIVVPKTLNPRTRSRSLGSHHNNSTPNFSVTRPTATANATANGPSSYTTHTRTNTHTSGSQFQKPPGPISGTTYIEAEKNGKPLRDPRDHTILSQAWNTMLDDRFISRYPILYSTMLS